jgi:hypothetical protein
MQPIDTCPICSGKALLRYDAKISPFLAARVWNKEPSNIYSKIELCRCKRCSFIFFNPRLEGAELAKLYKNYRDPEYVRIRSLYEENYTAELNDSMGNDPHIIEMRNRNLSGILKKNTDLASIRSVLDFGGDRGQFIADELASSERYVYEISGVNPLPGIHEIDTLDECKKHSYDLIMCCHVLEHVPFPQVELEQILSLAKNGTYVYIEVPCEVPYLSKLKFPFLIKIAHRLLKFDYNMHEHINFFNVKSVEALIIQHGLVPLFLEKVVLDLGETSLPVVSCLAVVRTDHGE